MIAKKELFVLRRSSKSVLVIYAETYKSLIELLIVISFKYFVLMLLICLLQTVIVQFCNAYSVSIKLELLFNQLAQI